MLWPSEQFWLAKAFSESNRHVEVGTYCGKSLFCACSGMQRTAKVIAVDDFSLGVIGQSWVESVLRATIAEIEKRFSINVEFRNSNSIDAAHNYSGPKLDSVFIDGNHHYAECKADIQAWTPHVKRGGIICGHDYWAKDSGVMDAVNETGTFHVVSGTRIWVRAV
jgi:predicted O-methyltransferase YrrM